jgi:GNAT superfamily N-acetyltransferase
VADAPRPRVRRLLPRERDDAVEAVVSAFAVDPLLRWVWPDDGRYARAAPAFFGLLLDLRMESGEAWGVDGTAAIAMWDPPGGLYLPTADGRWGTIQSGFTDLERRRWAAYDEVMSIAPAAAPYWYLGVLATAPDRQRQGLASEVIAPMLAAADRVGLPTYLETASEGNLLFYGRHGFEQVTSATPLDGPACWLLRRDPQPAAAKNR